MAMTGPRPSSYAEALDRARGLYDQAHDPDPVSRTRRIVAAAATRIGQVREQARARIRARWRSVDPYRGLDVAAFAADAGQVMAAAQTATATLTAAAQTEMLRVVDIDLAVVPSDPTDVRAPRVQIIEGGGGVVLDRPDELRVDYADGDDSGGGGEIVDDYSTEGIFNRPARAYRYERSRGKTAAEADEAATARIDVLVDENVMLAQRIAEHEALAQATDLDSRVIGYRRVIHPELSKGGVCGLCIAASDQVYEIADLKAIHAGCACTVCAVTREFDIADHLNDVDLTMLYGDAGGTSAKALKRTRYKVDEHGELGAVLKPQRRTQMLADIERPGVKVDPERGDIDAKTARAGRKRVARGLDRIEQVHPLIDPAPTIHSAHAPGAPPAVLGPRANGLYRPDGADLWIRYDRSTTESTIVHEYFHHIDHVLGGGVPVSAQQDPPEEVAKVLAAINASAPVRSLREGYGFDDKGKWRIMKGEDPKHVAYLLAPPELMARAYAQWIAEKTVSKRMQRDLGRFGPPGSDQHRQWTREEFAPIRAAMDEFARVRLRA